jgi:hypothetical protein
MSVFGRWLCFVSLLISTFAAQAQDFGDTPYVQTPQVVVDSMLKTAGVSGRDFVIDLGSGDGRMIITAAKRFGARGFGVDLDRKLVQLANANAKNEGVSDKAVFYARDLFETDLSPASVITLYLLPEVNLMARSKFLSLSPGTRIVSHDYGIGDWPPDSSYEMDAPGKSVGRNPKSRVLYWVVPDNVAGRWRGPIRIANQVQHLELAVRQNYQKVIVTASVAGRAVPVESAKLSGRSLSVMLTVPGIGGVSLTVERDHQVIEGTIRIAGRDAVHWEAARIELWDPEHLAKRPPVVREFQAD